MAQIQSVYQGSLRTQATHLQSQNSIITDAPTDNQGKGEAFSPTDLVCAALGSCMMTLMGITAQKHNLDLTGVRYDTTKIMAAEPRRIAEIQIIFLFPNHLQLSDADKIRLENAARTCPVSLSLSKDLKQSISFVYEG